MADSDGLLSIGDLSARSGLATSALRYYEDRGLIDSVRTSGNQRRFERAMLRRVAVIRAAQAVGLSLRQIEAALASLPDGRVPNKKDWERLSQRWRGDLDAKISELQRLRDDLSSCIGCGCLSLNSCRLLNAGDIAATRGAGPRYLMGDEPVG